MRHILQVASCTIILVIFEKCLQIESAVMQQRPPNWDEDGATTLRPMIAIEVITSGPDDASIHGNNDNDVLGNVDKENENLSQEIPTPLSSESSTDDDASPTDNSSLSADGSLARRSGLSSVNANSSGSGLSARRSLLWGDTMGPPDDNETPYSLPNNKKAKGYKKECSFYGSEFYQQQSKIPATVEEKQLAISDGMCRLNLRLECVPYPRQPTPTTPTPGPKQKIDETISMSHKRKGLCLCARALSSKAVFFKGERADSSDPKAANGKVHGGCYIPAGLGHASLCGHVVPLPYGTIDTGAVARKDYGNSTKMCVPNAECRIGYNWVGLRCACKKGANWIKQNGTCVIAGQPGTIIRTNGSMMSIVIIMLSTVYFICTFIN